MTKIQTTRRQFNARLDTKQDIVRAIPALMGDGNGIVEVPGQPGYVYIRVGDGDLGQAFNNRCPLRDNLAIYVGYDPVIDPDRRIFQVLSTRMVDYSESGSTPIVNVPSHHTYHEYGGGDDVYVDWRRLMGLRVGRPVAFQVTVDPGYIYRAGWIAIASTNVNLAATHAALTGTQAMYVLISLSSTGVVTATSGTIRASLALLLIADIPTPPAQHIPLAAIRLYKTQTSIGDTPIAPDIIDLRFPTYNTTSAYVTPHNILSVTHGDTLADNIVRGDILYGNATPKIARLALGGIFGSVVARNATDVIWSAGALSFSGAFTLTIPATGTAALGTGANTQVTYWSGTNTITGSALLTFNTASGLLNEIAPATNISSTLRLTTANRVGFADTGHDDFQFFDNAAMGFRFLAAFGNAAGTRYGGFIAYRDRDANALPLGFFTTDAGGSTFNVDGIWLSAGQTANTTPFVGIGKGLIAGAAASQLHVLRISTLTNTIGSVLRLDHRSTGAAANGYGSSFDWYLESSTTNDQQAYRQAVYWTDATHASRTPLYIGETYPVGAAVGHHGFWSYSGVAGVAMTVIPNAAGDVTEALTAVYVVSAVTAGDASGGTCTLEPSDTFNLYSDGTDTLALAVAADGSVTVQRTAGADTFKVSLWMVWQ